MGLNIKTTNVAEVDLEIQSVSVDSTGNVTIQYNTVLIDETTKVQVNENPTIETVVIPSTDANAQAIVAALTTALPSFLAESASTSSASASTSTESTESTDANVSSN